MKRFFTALLFILMIHMETSAADLLSADRYLGKGEWKDDQGNSGSYSVKTEISEAEGIVTGAKVVSSLYSFDNKEIVFTFTAVPKGHGFYEIRSEDYNTVLGEGYCLAFQCHYSIPIASLEETLIFIDQKLMRLGSKIVEGRKIVWRDELSK